MEMIAAGGPRHTVNAGSQMQEFLADHVETVKGVLNVNVEQLLTHITQHMRELQKDTSRSIEAELVQLRKENERLRSQLENFNTGGTDDTGTQEAFSAIKNTNAWSTPNEKDYPPHPNNGYAKIAKPAVKAPVMNISFAEDYEPEDHDLDVICGRTSQVVISTCHTHSEPGKAVFADASAMKEQVRKAVTIKAYDVCEYYKDKGFPQRIARHQKFEYITLFVIAFNAVWLSVDADLNTSMTLLDAEPIFQIAEHGFCVYFTFEWAMRFLAFKFKRNCLRDAWFVFDSALVSVMVLETWVMTVFLLVSTGGSGGTGLGNTSVLKLVRLVRLTRMARMAKLLRAIPELIILIKGMFVASRSVCFTLVLLSIILYFFAIVFRQLADETDVGEVYFNSVPDAMLSLLLDGVLPDQSAIVRACASESALFGLLALFFILLASLTVMNMLVGVLCEVVSVVSSVEKEQLTVSYVNARLHEMFGEWDTDGSMTISKMEFQKLLVMPEAAKIIHEIGVDVVGLVDFADFIFKDGSDLSFVDFMECVLSFRGSNQSTVKDVVDLRKFVLSELANQSTKIVAQLEGLQLSMTSANSKMLRKTMMAAGQGDNQGGDAPPYNPYPALPSFSEEPLPSSVHDGNENNSPTSRARPNSKSSNDRSPSNRNNHIPGSRPGPGGKRPVSSESGSRPNHGKKQHHSNDGTGSARIRGPSPPLPAYPQNLWLGEDEGQGGGDGDNQVVRMGASKSTKRGNERANYRVRPESR